MSEGDHSPWGGKKFPWIRGMAQAWSPKEKKSERLLGVPGSTRREHQEEPCFGKKKQSVFIAGDGRSLDRVQRGMLVTGRKPNPSFEIGTFLLRTIKRKKRRLIKAKARDQIARRRLDRRREQHGLIQRDLRIGTHYFVSCSRAAENKVARVRIRGEGR